MVRYSDELSLTFAALADPTRRRVLERLTAGPASVSELATSHDVTVPGMLKHLRVLENAGLLRTAKSGRVRRAGLTPRPMRTAARYIDRYRSHWERRFDALEDYLRKQGDDT
jgi:DNA-binding transcriptional ArsR family regulator